MRYQGHGLRGRGAHNCRLLLLGLTLAARNGYGAAAAGPSVPAPTPQQLQQQQQQLQQLQQQQLQQQALLRALEQRLQKLETGAATGAAASAPPATSAPAPGALIGSFGRDGYTLQSADGADAIHFRGNLSVDGRYFSDAYTPATADTWLVRKLRPTLEGTLDGRYDFRFMPDFGQGKAILQDGWGDARIAPWLVFQFGKFKAPVGLERLQLEQYQRFIEASLPSDLLPYRDLGFKVGGNLDGGVLNYDAGSFDGAPDGGSTDGNSVPDADSTGRFTWDGRLFAAPFLHSAVPGLQKLGFGVAETYVRDEGVATTTTTTSLLAAYKTPGQQPMFSYRGDTVGAGGDYNNATIANGMERRLVPQLYYYYGPVGLLSEYVQETQQVSRQTSADTQRSATLRNTAWQVQGYWYLTGEQEGYDVSGPRRNFGDGSPGAWELVARYHEIHFDERAFSDGADSFANPASAPRAAHAIGMGVNWYLTHNFKVQLDYEITHYDGGALAGNRPAERVLTSQFALIF